MPDLSLFKIMTLEKKISWLAMVKLLKNVITQNSRNRCLMSAPYKRKCQKYVIIENSTVQRLDFRFKTKKIV